MKRPRATDDGSEGHGQPTNQTTRMIDDGRRIIVSDHGLFFPANLIERSMMGKKSQGGMR